MKVLITGGAGFIGSHLAAFYQRRAQVCVLDDLRTGHRSNLAGLEVDFIEGSILDRALLARIMTGVDHVFHLAAMVSVAESVASPEACRELNITGLLKVLEAAAVARVKRFCFASSAAVYGDNPVVPKHEDMPPEPRSPYAATKLEGEHHCRQFSDSGRLSTVALRFFNVFGPRQDPAGPYGAAVPIFFREAAAGRPLRIHGDGAQTRDFIAVEDIVGAMDFVVSQPGLHGVFNAGYGRQISIHELAERIRRLTGSASAIEFAPARAGDVRHSCASVERLSAAGWRPAGTLDEGLARTWDSLRTGAAFNSRLGRLPWSRPSA
jgi:UDP-glucose 4-epimerase